MAFSRTSGQFGGYQDNPNQDPRNMSGFGMQDAFGQSRGAQGMNRGRGQQPQINDNFLNQSIQGGGFGANARNPSGLNMNPFDQSQFARQSQFEDTQLNRRGGFENTRRGGFDDNKRGGFDNTQFSRMGEFDETQFNRRGTPDIQNRFVANQFQRNANSSGGGRGAMNNTNQGGYVQPFALTSLDPRDPRSRTASQFDNNSGQSPDRMLLGAFGQYQGYENQQQNFQQSRNFSGNNNQFGRTGNMGFDQGYDQPMPEADSFESIINQMANDILTFAQYQPNKFFAQFDAFLDRQYEYWELMCMFKFTNQQARTLISKLGDTYGQHVTLKKICEFLRGNGIIREIDPLGFNLKSEYESKQLSATQKQVFLLFAKTLKNEKFSPLSGTYIEAFRFIHKQEGKGTDKFSCHVEAFTEFLNRECKDSFPNQTDIQTFVNYVQIGNEMNHMVNVCQFVRAMNKIEKDIRFVDDFKDLMDKICSDGLDTSTTFSKLKVLYNNLDRAILFKTVQELEYKKPGDDAALGKARCGKMADLESLIDIKLRGHFDPDERSSILREYSITPHVPKVEQKALRHIIAEDVKGKIQEVKEKLNISGSSSNLMQPNQSQSPPLGEQKQKIPTPELQSNPSRTLLPQIDEKIEVQEEDKEEDDSLDRNVTESQDLRGSPEERNVPEKKKGPDVKVELVQEDSYEEYDGGEQEGWFNLDLFNQDMALAPNVSLEQSFPSVIAFDVFEMMKRWYILTGKNVLQTFKSIDPKGHMMVNEKQLKTFLEQVYGSIKVTRQVPEIIIRALFFMFQRYNEQGGRCVDYSVLYNCYLHYSNRQKEPEALRGNNPTELQTIIKAIKDIIKQKHTDSKNFSLGQFVGLLAEFSKHQKKDRDLPLKKRFNQTSIMTSKENFFNKFHISVRKQVLNQAQKSMVHERIKSPNNLDIDMIKFIEFIGIDREVEISYTTKLRSVCQALQLKGIDFEYIQSSIPLNAPLFRFKDDMVKFLTPMGAKINQSLITVVEKLGLEYKVGNNINSKALLGRIQFEMNKLLYIERFYIKISKEIGHLTLPNFLELHKADLKSKTISVDNFKQLLHDLGIADHIVQDDGKISPEMSYFLDEYVAGDEKTIEIKKFEDDYEEIVAGPASFMEQLVSIFFIEINSYCQIKQISIVQAFVEAQKTAGSKVESSQNHWIHQFTFIQWYKQVISYLTGKPEPEMDQDLVNLFVQWMSEGGKGEKKDMIFLPNLFRKYQASVEVGNDLELESFQVEDAIKKLQIHILERLSQINKRPEEHFDRYVQMSEQQFMGLLSSPPLLYETLGLNVRLEIIASAYKDPQFDRIDMNRFVVELVELNEGQKKKVKVFLQISKNLELKGQTLEIYFAEIHGETESKTIEVSYEDFHYLFKKYYDDKSETAVKEEDLRLIFNQFQKDQYGEVTTIEFMREFKEAGRRKVTVGTALSDAGNQIVQKAVVEAKRFQTDTKSSLIQVAQQIVKSNMHTFGTYLKGYDFKNNGLIARQDFYKVFEQIFGNELGSGDILDLIEYFDPTDSGFISTEFVARELNYQIQDLRSDCLIRLTSNVQDLVLDRIVEPIISEKPKDSINEPSIFKKMLLDLLCSLLVQVKQNEYTYGSHHMHGDMVPIQQYFEEYIDESEKEREVGRRQISRHQFEAALNGLRVIGTQKEKLAVFKFVQHESSKLEDTPKEDTMEINQMANWLMNSNSKVYFDDRRLWEEILIQIATSCSNFLLPIKDMAERYEKGRGKILASDFSFNLIEKDFKMSKLITHNMIDLITLKYNSRREQVIEYEPFLNDLMAIESDKHIQDGDYKLVLRLFQTSQDVENYQNYLKTDQKNLKITVKYVAPLDEPQYSARTNNNTYYGATMMVTVKHQSKSQLEGIFNDVVLKSRSKGLSVEKYFQNDEFSNFSPEDGIRYVDGDGFFKAVSKLFDGKIRNEEIRQIFLNICEAFGQTEDFKLTLEQIGSVIFNQSTLSIVDEEAKSIEIVYEAINKMGLIENLHKVFNFMNSSRDCTVRSEDFLKFLANHLGLQNTLSRQNIEFLVQRYRSQKMDSKDAQGRPVYLIYFYKFLEDMHFMKSMIGLKDQAAARFAEQFIMAIQEQKIANSGQGLQGDEVDRELQNFMKENCTGEHLSFHDFIRCVDQLGLSEVIDMSQINDFFIYCEQGKFSFSGWRANSINVITFRTPNRVLISQFLKCLNWFCQKPLQVLYQEILDRVYISSKRRNVFVNGPYVTNIFNSEDQNRTGQVPIKVFSTKIQSELLAGREGKINDALISKELEFLATKYLKHGRSQVNYQQFFEDYGQIETEGLGTGYSSTNLIPRQEKTRTIMMSLSDQSKEIKSAFEILATHLVKHKKHMELCYMLSNIDTLKNGFMKRELIEKCLVKIAPKIKQVQMDLLVKPLSKDGDHNLNYLEMVFMLFGKETLNTHIESEKIQTSAVPQVFDTNVASSVDLVLSQGLIDDIELKYFIVLDRISIKAQIKGETFVRDQDVLVILMMECHIKINSDDLEVLKKYIQQTRDQTRFTINMLEILNRFGVTRHSADLLEKINQHLRKDTVDMNILFQKLPKEVNLTDFKQLLYQAQYSGLDDNIVNKDVEKLFRQICRRQSFAPKSSVMSFFTLPKQIVDFISIVQQKEIDLNELFKGQKKGDVFEVSINLMTSTLQKLNIFTPEIIAFACDYFSGKTDQIDMNVLLTCLQSQPIKKVKNLDFKGQPEQESVESLMKRAIKQYPAKIRLIIQKFAVHINKNKLSMDQVFRDLDYNQDGTVNPKEFDNYFLKNGLSDDLPKSSVERLFKYLDSNNDGTLSINELELIIKTGLQTFNEKLQSNFSKEFDKELHVEVKALFLKIVGIERDSIKPEEMLWAFKPQDSAYHLDLDTVKKLDSDGDGLISLPEFEAFVVTKQKQQMLQMESQMEEIRRIFSQHVSVSSEKVNARQLSEQQLKQLFIKLGMHEETEQEYAKRVRAEIAGSFKGKRFTTAKTGWLTDVKIRAAFQLIDINKNGLIDIDELMAWLYNNDQLESDDAKDLLMNVRKTSFKLNEQSFFQLLMDLPETYMPSCTQPKLECESKVTPSMSLQPRYDFSERQFKEIDKIRGFKAEQDQQYISFNRPAHAFEVKIGEIVGISNLNPKNKTHVEMRIFLFDSQRKLIVSGVHTVNCSVKDGDAMSSPWTIQDSLRTLYMRTNDTLQLVIEFVHYRETNKDQQVMVGWAKLELGKAIQKQQFGMAKSLKSQHKLELFGGSPFGRTEKPVRTKEDEAIGSSAKDKFLKAFGQKVKVERFVTLEVTEFGNFSTQIQKDICAIPENVICYKKLLSFAAQYRSYTYNSLIKDQQQMKKPKADLVLSQFSKIYDSPDIQAVLADHWPKILETSSGEKALKDVITKLYVVTYDRKFTQNSIYPTRSTTGNDFQMRRKIIEQALGQRVEAAPASVELVLLEDYQPFNVCEIMSDELLKIQHGL